MSNVDELQRQLMKDFQGRMPKVSGRMVLKCCGCQGEATFFFMESNLDNAGHTPPACKRFNEVTPDSIGPYFRECCHAKDAT